MALYSSDKGASIDNGEEEEEDVVVLFEELENLKELRSL